MTLFSVVGRLALAEVHADERARVVARDELAGVEVGHDGRGFGGSARLLGCGGRRRLGRRARRGGLDRRRAGVHDGGGDLGRRRRAGARAAGDRERGDEGEGARLAPANDPNLGHGLVPPGVTASDAREERDRLGDPVDGEVRALVQLADQPFVAGREQREHHLIDRHEDRTDVLDRVALVGHRPRRRLETRECGDERGEVDARPVALDQEGRERGWIARSVHAPTMPAGLPRRKGRLPRSVGGWRLRIRRHQGPELGPRVDAELLVDAAEDVADGLRGEERALGDLAAGEA